MSVYVKDASVNSNHLTQNEVHLYGSSRLGILNVNEDLEVAPQPPVLIRGNKFFELSNHLGNVLVTISDKKLQIDDGNGNIDYYTADIVTANDYYPFGMLMPERKYNIDKAVYGFNGMRKDNEIYGEGNAYDFGARIYDSRLGRWMSLDPLGEIFPNESPYCFVGNNPIGMIDPDGKRKYIVHLQYDVSNGTVTLLKIESRKGLMRKIRRVDRPKNNSTYVDYREWYNYQTFKITVINGDPNVKYDIKIPDRTIGKPVHTSTQPLTDFEGWASFWSGDDITNGIMYTDKYGLGVGTRKGTAEFITNIESLVIALTHIQGPVKLVIPKIDDIPEIATVILNLGNELRKDFKISFEEENSNALNEPQASKSKSKIPTPQLTDPAPQKNVGRQTHKFVHQEWTGKTSDGKTDSTSTWTESVPVKD